MINLAVQRFLKGHPFFSEVSVNHANPAPPHEMRSFQFRFGQMVDEEENRIIYTGERLDTLIPAGTYNFSVVYSTNNRCYVLILHDVPGFQYIEVHIANYDYELEGCTACGLVINVTTPQLVSSTLAFEKLISFILGQPFKMANQELLKPYAESGDILGTITYEDLAE
jgi:hypothetical protein